MDKKGHWQKEAEHLDYQAFVIQLDEQTFAKVENGFTYQPNTIRPDLTSGAWTALDSLANYLKEHNEKMLHISASYQEMESNIQLGALATLGAGRGHWFTQALVQKGISQSRMIFTDSLISNNIPNFIQIQITPQPH